MRKTVAMTAVLLILAIGSFAQEKKKKGTHRFDIANYCGVASGISARSE